MVKMVVLPRDEGRPGQRGTMADRGWGGPEQSRRGSVGRLAPGTHLASRHELPDVVLQARPPESVANELAGPGHKDPASDGLGDEETVGWAPGRDGLSALGLPNSRFEPPREDADNPGRRYDGGRVRDLRGMLTLMNPGESIRPNVLGPWAVGQGVIEMAEQESPTRLPGTQSLRLPDVGEILVVRPDKHGKLGALQPVSPFLQGSVDRQ